MCDRPWPPPRTRVYRNKEAFSLSLGCLAGWDSNTRTVAARIGLFTLGSPVLTQRRAPPRASASRRSVGLCFFNGDD